MYDHNTYLTWVLCDLQMGLFVFYVKIYVVLSKYTHSYLVLWFMSLNLNTLFFQELQYYTFLFKLREVVYI